jgi:adenylate cyclase
MVQTGFTSRRQRLGNFVRRTSGEPADRDRDRGTQQRRKPNRQQRAGKQVRVTAELIDAENAAHLWAERFDRDIGDVFALQNDITRQIAVALGFELIAAENAKPSQNLDAVDFLLRGRAKMLNPPAKENFAQMISLYDRAAALDPQSVVANSYLVTALLGRVLNGMSDTAAADIDRAEGLVSRALAISPRNPHAHLVWYLRIGIVHLLQSRTDEAVPWLEKARNFDPQHPQPHPWLAAAYALKGDTERAAVELAEARMLNGDDRYSSIARLKAAGYFGVPKIRALYEATYFAGLREAGMPEE